MCASFQNLKIQITILMILKRGQSMCASCQSLTQIIMSTANNSDLFHFCSFVDVDVVVVVVISVVELSF